jgi:hypothetical protein
MADAVASRFDVLLSNLSIAYHAISSSKRQSFAASSTGESASSASPTATTATRAPGESCCAVLRGLLSETYLDDLRAKTHRGLTGQIERGYHAGGLSYGYRFIVAGVNPRGEPIGHRLEIGETHAVIVREIFGRYAAGESCQRIAADLNARGVRGPRGEPGASQRSTGRQRRARAS